MGAILGSAIILQCAELASDTDQVVWTNAQALEWLNDGQRAICNVRPDACSEIVTLQLSQGTKQAITGRRLLKVIRNMGSDGATDGAAITKTDMDMMDQFNKDWHTDTGDGEIDHYMFDDRVPTTFWVYPQCPASPNTWVQLSQAIEPTDLSADSDPIDIEDTYAPALIEWIMYRFFGRDSEDTPNWTRSRAYLQSFFNLLGVKTNVDMQFSPNYQGVPKQ